MLSVAFFYYYAECCVLFIIMLNDIMLSVIMLNVVMLSVLEPQEHLFSGALYNQLKVIKRVVSLNGH
jgi:hypothetical protein